MIDPPMKISETGLERIRGYESYSPYAYRDSGGIWTIGYGHTGSDVTPHAVWTLAYAETVFKKDVQGTVDAVNKWTDVPLDQNEFDALVSFAYNCGYAPTLWRLLNEGDYKGASEQFPKWDHVHGQVIAGLLRRRLSEQDLFDGGVA